MAWSNSERLSELPPDWKQVRKRVLDHYRHRCAVSACGAKANQVDHIEPGGSHEDWNLQALCEFHHNKKSSAEGHAARRRLNALLKREPEEHPGRIPPHEAKPRVNIGF